MIALLALYEWALLAGLATAPGLAILGAQLATRDRVMQILCVSQGALLGVILGIGFFHKHEGTLWLAVAPLLCAFAVSSFTYVTTEWIVRESSSSKNTTFAIIFCLLIAASHVVSALLPGLESHMSQVYFGDLTTLSVLDSQFLLVGSLHFLTILLRFLKAFSHHSFESAVFGKILSKGAAGEEFYFRALTLFALCISVQFLGFLFTISMLFLPTGMLALLKRRGLRFHYLLCTLLAVSSTLLGFLLSLAYTRLPTVPTIVLVLFCEAGLFLLIEKVQVFFWKISRTSLLKNQARGQI